MVAAVTAKPWLVQIFEVSDDRAQELIVRVGVPDLLPALRDEHPWLRRVQREYLGHKTGELTMQERGQSRLMSLRRSATLHIDRVARRRHAEDRRPGLEMDLFDRSGDRDTERTARLARPRADLGGDRPCVYP